MLRSLVIPCWAPNTRGSAWGRLSALYCCPSHPSTQPWVSPGLHLPHLNLFHNQGTLKGSQMPGFQTYKLVQVLSIITGYGCRSGIHEHVTDPDRCSASTFCGRGPVPCCTFAKLSLETTGWLQRGKVEHEEGKAGGAGVLWRQETLGAKGLCLCLPQKTEAPTGKDACC